TRSTRQRSLPFLLVAQQGVDLGVQLGVAPSPADEWLRFPQRLRQLVGAGGRVHSVCMDILPLCPCLSTPPVQRSVPILATNGPQSRGMLGPCPPSFYLISCPFSARGSLSPHASLPNRSPGRSGRRVSGTGSSCGSSRRCASGSP